MFDRVEEQLTDDHVLFRNEALLQRLGLGVHYYLAARKTLAHVVVRVSLHLLHNTHDSPTAQQGP